MISIGQSSLHLLYDKCKFFLLPLSTRNLKFLFWDKVLVMLDIVVSWWILSDNCKIDDVVQDRVLGGKEP